MILGNIINLDNNYYLKILNKPEDLIGDITDIENINLVKILKKKRFLLKVDFKSINKKQYKKILKNLLFVRKRISKSAIGILENSKIKLGYLINYDEKNKEQNDFILAINAIFYNTRYERYNYIYDTACDYLDSYFYGKNLCDFKDSQCGEKRGTSSLIGCCHHYKNKFLGPISIKSNLIPCEHLKNDYTCGAKCIGCKLFTCDYLKKKGVKFRIKDILLLDVFFNPLQKYVIKYNVFTPKDKIMKRIMIL